MRKIRESGGAGHRVRLEILTEHGATSHAADFYVFTAEQARVLAIYLSRCIDLQDYRCTVQVLSSVGYVTGNETPREVHRTTEAYLALQEIRKQRSTFRMDVEIIKGGPAAADGARNAESDVIFSLYFYSSVDMGTAFHLILKGLDRTYKLISCYQHMKSSRTWQEIAPMGYCDRDVANVVNRLSFEERLELIEHINRVLHRHGSE